MPTFFVLGPHSDPWTEPEPIRAPIGLRQIVFGIPPIVPGGFVNLTLLPPHKSDDLTPIAVYVFYASPIASLPAEAELTPDHFFKGGYPSGSKELKGLPDNGRLTIKVPNVQPSPEPFRVQVVVEYPS